MKLKNKKHPELEIPWDLTIFISKLSVMPNHINCHNENLIFGGALFSEMDLASANLVRGLLHYSVCDNAVTHKVNGLVFSAPTYLGDLLTIQASLTELKTNSFVIDVRAFKTEKPCIGIYEPKFSQVASAEFVFVSKRDQSFYPHDLYLEI
jgi:acyl-CoA hydrolase